MGKTKLSPHQLIALASGFSFGSIPLLLPSSIAELAGPDAWLATLFASVTGLIFIWIYAKLGELNPNKTFVEIIQQYFGKWAGGFVAVFYILSALVLADQVVWYFGDFIHTEFRSDLSFLPFNFIFIAVLVFALWCGVETMYRTTELLLYILFPTFIFAALLLMPNIKPGNLLPIMENGVAPVLKGSIPFLVNCTWPLVFLNMVYPVCFENVKEAKKALFKGYILGSFTASTTVIICVLVMGSSLIANIRFPMYVTNKEIDVIVVFSRIELVTVSVAIGVSIIAAFSYAYAGILGLAQLLKLKSYKILILPIGLLFALYSQYIYSNVDYELKWDSVTWTPLSFTLGFILPLILLILSIIKKRKSKSMQ